MLHRLTSRIESPSGPGGGRRGGANRTQVYVSLSRLRVDAARADELIEAFRGRARLVDAFDGFVDLEVWQSDRDDGEVVMVSRWRDREAFSAYMRSDAHRTSHDRIPADVERSIRLERLEHLHTFNVVAR